jgi:tRNA(Ile)-lysidine synthase
LRNYLRHEVLPLIARRFPSYRATVARSARHVAEANEVLDEVAAMDGAGSLRNGTLAVEGLRRLSAARARNLLRFFISGHGLSMPAAGRLDEALRQALTAKRDARVAIELEGACLRRYEGLIHVVRAGKAPRHYTRRWRGERRLALARLGGVLILSPATGAGISLARLRGQPVTIRLRRGGERLQPDGRRPRRSLKNLLQELRLPPWQRERLPLLCCGEDLVWVPGVGVDAGYQAGRGEPGLHPEWAAAV